MSESKREFVEGCELWRRNGVFHRTDGPAIVHADSTREWWYEGLPHRVAGPAVECANGDKAWFRNGVLIHHHIHASSKL